MRTIEDVLKSAALMLLDNSLDWEIGLSEQFYSDDDFKISLWNVEGVETLDVWFLNDLVLKISDGKAETYKPGDGGNKWETLLIERSLMKDVPA